MTLPAEVDTSNADQVREDLLATVGRAAARGLAGRTAPTFGDSAGVTVLVRVVRQATARGSGLRLAAAAPAVTRVLALTGVDKLIPVYPSVAAALAGREDADPGDDVAADPPDDAVPSAHPE